MKRHVKVTFKNTTGDHVHYVGYDNDTTCGPIVDKIRPICQAKGYPSPVFMIETAGGSVCHKQVL